MQSDVVRVRWVDFSRANFFMMWLLLCLLLPTVSVADDYLSELETEAELSAEGASDDGASMVRGGAIGSPKHNPAEQRNFEHVLELERPHVHTFYKRLSNAEKMQVVTQYMNNSENISKATNQVLDLYFQKK